MHREYRLAGDLRRSGRRSSTLPSPIRFRRIVSGSGCFGTTEHPVRPSQTTTAIKQQSAPKNFKLSSILHRRIGLCSDHAASIALVALFGTPHCRSLTWSGCPTWIRTMNKGSKGLCVTVTPSGNESVIVSVECSHGSMEKSGAHREEFNSRAHMAKTGLNFPGCGAAMGESEQQRRRLRFRSPEEREKRALRARREKPR